MQILTAKHILAPTVIGIVILIIWATSGHGRDVHPHPSVALAGLTGVDVSEIGPWVLNEDRKLEEVKGLTAELQLAAREHLTGA